MSNKNLREVDLTRYFSDITRKKEDAYLKEQSGASLKQFLEKEEDIVKVLTEIENEDKIGPEQLKALRQLSIEKGGFLLQGYRRKIWLNLLCIDPYEIESNQYVFIKDRIKSFSNAEIFNFSREERYSSTMCKDDDIIEKDVKRSIANLIFENRSKQDALLIEKIKTDLECVLKKFCHITSNYFSYSYYQGFHDIALYVYLIFFNNVELAVFALQRLSEFFFRDFLIPSNLEGNKFEFCTVLKIVSNLINKINPDIAEKIKVLNEGNELHYCLEWVLGWFSHSINDMTLVYRLMDYFLLSHPSIIYYFSAVLIIEITKCLPEKKSDLAEFNLFYTYFQELNPKNIDFESIIMACENATRLVPLAELLKECPEIYHSSPLRIQEPCINKIVSKRQKRKKRSLLYPIAVVFSILVLLVSIYVSRVNSIDTNVLI